jgi:hypothetical protein
LAGLILVVGRSTKVPQCSVCSTELVKKDRRVLITAGAALAMAAIGLVFADNPWLWLFALFLASISFYLLSWGIAGKGYWCRTCKRIPPDLL